MPRFEDEEAFKEAVIRDLEEGGITIIDLGAGTFDAWCLNNRKFLEFKMMSWDPNWRCDTVKFTESQTEAIRKLRCNLIVLAYRKNGFYLLTPDLPKRVWECRERKPYLERGKPLWIGTTNNELYIDEETRLKPVGYDKLVKDLTSILRGVQVRVREVG